MSAWKGRAPCKGCGGPKGPGRGRDYCDECATVPVGTWEQSGPDAFYEAWNKHPRNIARMKERGEQRMARAKARLLEFLEQGCADCGETDVRVLQIDHVDGKTMSKATMLGVSAWRREAELALCAVRCANCHLRRHVDADTFGEAGRKGGAVRRLRAVS